PGGALIASVPAYRFLWSGHDIALHHQRRYSRRELRDLLREAGFEMPRLTFLMTALFPFVVAFRVLDRLKRRSTGEEPQAHLVPVSDRVNALLLGLQNAELAVARHVTLPFGVSLLAVARKPPCAAESPAAARTPVPAGQ